MVVMRPALVLGPGHEFARRGTDKTAKLAGQVRLVEVAMPRRERRETNHSARTLRAGESCLDVRQDTLQAEDFLQNLGADPDVDIEKASEVTVRNPRIRRGLADTPGTEREQRADTSLDDRIRCHAVLRFDGQLVQQGPERLSRRIGGRESLAEHRPASRHVLDGDVSISQVTGGDPEKSGRHARPQAYTDERDPRLDDLDGWTSSWAPDIDSATEPMEEMNPAVRHRAMAVRLTLSGNLLHPQAPHELTEPRGRGKLMERAPRAVVCMWIPHQSCSAYRDPIAGRRSSHRRTHGVWEHKGSLSRPSRTMLRVDHRNCRDQAIGTSQGTKGFFR